MISATLCVDRDVYAPWPLHAVDIDGRERQIDLAPGELLLYESARIVHGRPVPLNGRYHVGLFVHYRPADDYDLWLESPRSWAAKHRPDALARGDAQPREAIAALWGGVESTRDTQGTESAE